MAIIVRPGFGVNYEDLGTPKNHKYKRSKYGNHKTTIDGIKFDSQKEAQRYMVLKDMEKHGEIFDLRLQPKFVLQESFKIRDDTKKSGWKTERAITYIADFEYKQYTNTYYQGKATIISEEPKVIVIIEDVKGHKTEVYKIKRKLLIYKYPYINFIET